MRPQELQLRSQSANLIAAFLTASILIVAMDAVAGGRQGNAAVKVLSNKTSARAFLSPLSTATTLAPNDQQVSLLCAGTSRNGLCPDFSRHGGARGGAPFQALNFATNAPNLRVTLVLDEVSNTLVAGDGANEPNRATRLTHSPIARLERYPYGPLIELYAPQPGETWQYGGCSNMPAVFPVEFDSVFEEIDNGPTTIGEFHAMDDTILVPTGYWKLHYTVHTSSPDGGVSDFTVDGTVSVVCTALDTL